MSVTLSFTGGTSGAWDDRELVNAYDTAMEEFHVGLGQYVSCEELTTTATPSRSRILAG
jgi:hypothetical protein